MKITIVSLFSFLGECWLVPVTNLPQYAIGTIQDTTKGSETKLKSIITVPKFSCPKGFGRDIDGYCVSIFHMKKHNEMDKRNRNTGVKIPTRNIDVIGPKAPTVGYTTYCPELQNGMCIQRSTRKPKITVCPVGEKLESNGNCVKSLASAVVTEGTLNIVNVFNIAKNVCPRGYTSDANAECVLIWPENK